MRRVGGRDQRRGVRRNENIKEDERVERRESVTKSSKEGYNVKGSGCLCESRDYCGWVGAGVSCLDSEWPYTLTPMVLFNGSFRERETAPFPPSVLCSVLLGLTAC